MKCVWLASLAICVCLCVTCSKNAGVNNAHTETRTIPALLCNSGGSPAVHAKVFFYPINYNPRSGGLAKKTASADSATTDSTGNYSVKLDTGTYNVLASGDSGVVYQDSITVTKDSAIRPPADTLKTPGGLRGRVRLQPGDDARTVFILFMGTNTWGTPDDTTGKFSVTNMAQGTYKVRVLTTLDAYVPKDTTLSVTSGTVDSLTHDIVLRYTGIPGPTGLAVSYDTLRQTVILAWTGADRSLIAGYNVYRAIIGQNFSLITQTPLPDSVTAYRDSTVPVGAAYEYEVVSRNASGQESPKVATPGNTVNVVPSSLVTTTFTGGLNNAIGDTASINDTIKVCLTYSNPTRKMVKVVWYADSVTSPAVRQKPDSSLAGKDTLAYSWKQAGSKKIFARVTDGAGTVWTDTVAVIVIQDMPTVRISGKDTAAINAPVTFTVQTTQEFGRITKHLWDNGVAPGYDDSTGSAYTFKYPAEGAFTVKVLVTDNHGNTNTATKTILITNDKPVITGLRDTTISINDSVVFTVNATDSNGILEKYYWNFGDGSGLRQDTTTSNTIGHKFPSAEMRCSVSVAVADSFGKQGVAKAVVTVSQDVPVITFVSPDTVVDHGGTVRCSLYVQQQFGTMTVGIDTANTGTYKGLGSLGLSGGKEYSFSTGNACSWDSVKIRVADDDANVAVKGFRVRVRPRPLTITSIDSTVSAITVRYGQSQETDFAQYRIYRNTTNAVDATGELWATITAVGTVSYATPSPSYAWQPRYYRVFQTDSEGVCSAGSNVVYGNIMNSPPSTPDITYPAIIGDSIWPNDNLRWSVGVDPNRNGVRYRVLVNYNNTGYVQFATGLTDTFVHLAGCDSVLSLTLKVIAYDTLGDSSAWSAEKTAFIRHTITDIDGNSYHIVTIGTQLWMAQNLKTTQCNDGSSIPLDTSSSAWSDLTTPGYCWFNNDPAANKDIYGALYNGYAVSSGALAPSGWHVPTDSEWTVLMAYLGGDNMAAGKLKEAGTAHWWPPNTGATNAAGFSALPGGWRTNTGSFQVDGRYGYWWSSTAFDSTDSWTRILSYSGAMVVRNFISNASGSSVRCVRNP